MSGSAANPGGRADRVPAAEGFAGYEVLDPQYQRIGSAEELLMDKDNRPRYVRVRIGVLGSRSVLIPVEALWVDEERRILLLHKTASRTDEASNGVEREGRRGSPQGSAPDEDGCLAEVRVPR